MYVRDTIAAIATPLGEGGIGIVRISGDNACAMAERLFSGKRDGGFESHRFYYGTVRTAAGGTLDEVLLVCMRAPRSYTREDVVEIHCHGGSLIVQELLAETLRQGARLAQPGEFTKRAFLNGRVDLLQAEAVIDLIRAKTDASLALAQHQREGLLSQQLASVKGVLVQTLALVEAHIDFPEEEIDPDSLAEVISQLDVCSRELIRLVEGYRQGRVLREGVAVLIAGKPNVGKSSLLNTLLRERRAIVTSVPGTTRDIIEEIVNLGGLPIRLLDTAGIRPTDDLVEREGVRLTLEQLGQADLVLFLLDASRPLDDNDLAIIDELRDRPFLPVLTKADLPCRLQLPEDLAVLGPTPISTVTGEGIDTLRTQIRDTFFRGAATDSREYVAISQARHRDALAGCREAVERCQSALAAGISLELLAVELREALAALGQVTGETTPDEVLDLIFSRFCIGK